MALTKGALNLIFKKKKYNNKNFAKKSNSTEKTSKKNLKKKNRKLQTQIQILHRKIHIIIDFLFFREDLEPFEVNNQNLWDFDHFR